MSQHNGSRSRLLKTALVVIASTAVIVGVTALANAGWAPGAAEGPSDLPIARMKDLPANKLDALRQTGALEATARAATRATKSGRPTPAADAPEPAKAWGLLPADAGPVPVPSRAYVLQNKWLGEVDHAFVAVYAGAERQNASQGVLVVFRPDNTAQALQFVKAPAGSGTLTIEAVNGSLVTLRYAGGQGTFDLATNQFHF